jgi:large subunit ribosomal protein L30
MPKRAKSAAARSNSEAGDETSSAGEGTIRIQYYRSSIATPKTHKQMVLSLGLTKLNQIVERPDNASTRGAVAKIPHLLRIIE